LPLYSGVDYLEIGVNEGAAFEEVVRTEKPVVFYGTSVVQGGCASRPGMAHTAIIGRWLDREVINLGFSGSAKSEMEIADLLAEIDAEVYVLDAMPNMTNQEMEQRYREFARRLRKARPDTPFVMVGHLKPDMVAGRT